MFTRVNNILNTLPKRKKGAGTFLALRVRQTTKEVLDKMCRDYPEEVARSVKVKTFKNGILTVQSPQLLSAELHTRSGELKEDINRVLGKDVVEKIRFRIN
ncbi:hypothetical protein A2164_00795 [Candidatus Curtissbacteria bacterium RBG_13_35_7]|uniref:Uncharacterized protein n=1 Tax=Candidatus Curtissbacteria bacterium RBG_13_35_7 TaxID=1797705 RepID=A0A1F5G0Z2_9BACT|nr:MAG: hypothetical protein A2164_00795 [Candidatus Curtissbacteria bacterium RBG_13_35_7]